MAESAQSKASSPKEAAFEFKNYDVPIEEFFRWNGSLVTVQDERNKDQIVEVGRCETIIAEPVAVIATRDGSTIYIPISRCNIVPLEKPAVRKLIP